MKANHMGEYLANLQVEVEAVKWYRKVTEKNDAPAQLNLALCYYSGEGVAKDPLEAYKWWRLAAAQNLEGSNKNMLQLESLMTREQFAAGKQRADDWLKQRKTPPLNNQ